MCTWKIFPWCNANACTVQRATGHVPVVMTSSATEFNLQRPPLPLNFRPLCTLATPHPVVFCVGIILGNGPRVSGVPSIFLCPKKRRLVRNLISCFLLARASRSLVDEHTNRWIRDKTVSRPLSFLGLYVPFVPFSHGNVARPDPRKFMRMRCCAGI